MLGHWYLEGFSELMEVKYVCALTFCKITRDIRNTNIEMIR